LGFSVNEIKKEWAVRTWSHCGTK